MVGIVYPGGVDAFNVPSLPEGTPLSETGSATRNHPELHEDINSAVEALEGNAAFKDHNHSGDGTTAHGNKLAQVNTHQSADTDTAAIALHHTLGTTAFQAAPGNHVHSYNQLQDRPYIVCTSLTRPTQPFIGMQIYETDTNTVRVWAVFPGNPDVAGIIGSDDFTRTSVTDLGADWDQHYLLGAGHGTLATPNGTASYWSSAGLQSNWCLARRINVTDQHTLTDNQEITATAGARGYDFATTIDERLKTASASNDYYLRLSDDRVSYCRLAIYYNWVTVYYTTSGYLNEIPLGNLATPQNKLSPFDPLVPTPGASWTLRVVDWEFHVYRNGIFVGSVVDADHAHVRGASNRGWGIGVHVQGDAAAPFQARPEDVSAVEIRDVVSYISSARWGLLPVASIPVLVAESTVGQAMAPGIDTPVQFPNKRQDWLDSFLPYNFSDITITEPGIYHVQASICWDPQKTFQDQSMIGIKVNGLDIGRKHWEFIRGFGYSPGFSQTNEINFWYRFNAGDRLQVIGRHNAPQVCWLWWDFSSPDAQVSHVELVYHSP